MLSNSNIGRMKMSTCALLFLIFSLFSTMQIPIRAAKRPYVVYLGRHSHVADLSTSDIDRITDSHYELLGSCMGSKEKAKKEIFYSYTNYINGFAATLEDEEAAQVSKRPEVVSIFLDKLSKLHTTRSWEFLGLERNGEIPGDSLWRKARFGEDVIIATLDSGVWPESESFNDEGMGPVPTKWKGYCDTNDGVKCNRKLIGARYFNKGYEASVGYPLNSSYYTARDTAGHGTHTLSTAGGGFVTGANLFGSANGTAKGGSPKARVVSYKVCWPDCTDSDKLSAFEAAIHDGVDIISVSLGQADVEVRPDYFLDSTAIGSFHAVRNGILVVCSAGNDGPTYGTVDNLAPWILTVGASTIDRDFASYVTLGNNKKFKGFSLNTNTLPAGKFYPLIYAMDAKVANALDGHAQYCSVGSLDPRKVKGKIVYCLPGPDLEEKSMVVAKAGGAGMIVANSMTTEDPVKFPQAYFVPTSLICAADGLSILLYILNTKSPMAYINGTTEVGTVAAPTMAFFSSPGPSKISPEILKPDITAPGDLILAAYTEATGPSSIQPDQRHLPFNIISGTSMSCPHVSGIAGLLKTVHPEWSPAAIRSAMMTTATTRSNVRQPIANYNLVKAIPLNYGAGHIWPNRAMDPGLVYDLTVTDYLNFLCSKGYNETQLIKIAHKAYNCPSKNTGLLNLNYPSITVPNLSGNVTVTRTLKNVGTPGIYKVRIKEPNGVVVKVEPVSLEFNKLNEEKTFKLTLEAKENSKKDIYLFGGITWSDGKHQVRSPIVVVII